MGFSSRFEFTLLISEVITVYILEGTDMQKFSAWNVNNGVRNGPSVRDYFPDYRNNLSICQVFTVPARVLRVDYKRVVHTVLSGV